MLPERIARYPETTPVIEDGHPKVGDVVGDRTIISVGEKIIVFGQREGDLPNCGAYLTNYREWFNYEREQG